jgi:hypothetical protein
MQITTTIKGRAIAAGSEETATSSIVSKRGGREFRISAGVPLWRARQLADALAAADDGIARFHVLDSAGRVVYTPGC